MYGTLTISSKVAAVRTENCAGQNKCLCLTQVRMCHLSDGAALNCANTVIAPRHNACSNHSAYTVQSMHYYWQFFSIEIGGR